MEVTAGSTQHLAQEDDEVGGEAGEVWVDGRPVGGGGGGGGDGGGGGGGR